MTVASTNLPIASSRAIAPSSIQGTGDQNFSSTRRSACALTSGDCIGTKRVPPPIRLCAGQPDRRARGRDFRQRRDPCLFVSSTDRHSKQPN